LADDYG